MMGDGCGMYGKEGGRFGVIVLVVVPIISFVKSHEKIGFCNLLLFLCGISRKSVLSCK
jgi:hypothetical protein